MESIPSVVALCGPSGIGKGHTKKKLLSANEGFFAEPTIVTTRATRDDDRGAIGRRTGVSECEYQSLVDEGEVILDHRPFRIPSTPRYGFDRASTNSPRPLLTEVHSSIIKDFTEYFSDRKILVLGFIATYEMLKESITNRGQTDNTDIRLAMSLQEQAEIEQAHLDGLVNGVHRVTFDNRDDVQDTAIGSIIEFVRN